MDLWSVKGSGSDSQRLTEICQSHLVDLQDKIWVKVRDKFQNWCKDIEHSWMPNSEWIKIGLTPCLPTQNQVILKIYCHNFMLRSQWCSHLSTSCQAFKMESLSAFFYFVPWTFIGVDYLFLDLMLQMRKLPPDFICLTVIIPVLKICMDGNKTVSEFAPSCWDIAFPQ